MTTSKPHLTTSGQLAATRPDGGDSLREALVKCRKVLNQISEAEDLGFGDLMVEVDAALEQSKVSKNV